MQFYKSDLLQYISGSISDTDLLEQLTKLGLEVDQSKKEKNDLLIKLDLTPNRGDCFSLIGIARDVCAVNNLKLKLPKFKKQQQSLDSKKTISVDKNACSSYLGQIIKLKSKPISSVKDAKNSIKIFKKEFLKIKKYTIKVRQTYLLYRAKYIVGLNEIALMAISKKDKAYI